MRRLALALGTCIALLAAPAFAQDGDVVGPLPSHAQIGQQFALRIEVLTPPGSTVEIDPAAESWGAMQVVRIESQEQIPEDGEVRHILTIIVAPFGTGAIQFAPAVNVITGPESSPRVLEAVELQILESLAADAPLELSPLRPPVAIGGAESPLLRPAIALGIVAAIAALGGLSYVVVRRIVRRPRGPALDEPAPAPIPDLAGAGALLDSDPVTAYRTLAAAVRRHLADQYGFPAVALTARELERRMESEGIDRWQARLVGGLLENCDAVVYAGYRPAAERRRHDLTMAREIVEAAP